MCYRIFYLFQSSLIGNLRKADLLTSDTIFLEFGAGRGIALLICTYFIYYELIGYNTIASAFRHFSVITTCMYSTLFSYTVL